MAAQLTIWGGGKDGGSDDWMGEGGKDGGSADLTKRGQGWRIS
jgi:hypothetical protein